MKTTFISEAEFKVIDELARDKNLTQREISRRAKVSVGLVNLALKKLDVLTPGGFSALTKRSYRFLIQEELVELLKKIQESYSQDVLQVILFGSAARGDIREDSDIDLLVISKDGEDRLKGELINIKTPFIKNVLSEGKILWKR